MRSDYLDGPSPLRMAQLLRDAGIRHTITGDGPAWRINGAWVAADVVAVAVVETLRSAREAVGLGGEPNPEYAARVVSCLVNLVGTGNTGEAPLVTRRRRDTGEVLDAAWIDPVLEAVPQ